MLDLATVGGEREPQRGQLLSLKFIIRPYSTLAASVSKQRRWIELSVWLQQMDNDTKVIGRKAMPIMDWKI